MPAAAGRRSAPRVGPRAQSSPPSSSASRSASSIAGPAERHLRPAPRRCSPASSSSRASCAGLRASRRRWRCSSRSRFVQGIAGRVRSRHPQRRSSPTTRAAGRRRVSSRRIVIIGGVAPIVAHARRRPAAPPAPAGAGRSSLLTGDRRRLPRLASLSGSPESLPREKRAAARHPRRPRRASARSRATSPFMGYTLVTPPSSTSPSSPTSAAPTFVFQTVSASRHRRTASCSAVNALGMLAAGRAGRLLGPLSPRSLLAVALRRPPSRWPASPSASSRRALRACGPLGARGRRHLRHYDHPRPSRAGPIAASRGGRDRVSGALRLALRGVGAVPHG